MRAALLAALLATLPSGGGAQLGSPWRARRSAVSPAVISAAGAPPVQRFAQRVDHFDALNNASWPQRYFANETFWAAGDRSAVFLCVGGEGPALEPSVVVTGGSHCADAVVLAARTGALLLALEHRFYGESVPAPDVSTASLRLLSSRQALADVASFLGYASQRFGFTPSTRVIAFGGSYPGMVAAWSRLRFPHLIHAAVASSAPVAPALNFAGYNDAVGAALENPRVGGDAACGAATRAAFAALGDALRTPEGRRSLEQAFPICAPEAAGGVTLAVSPGGAGPLDDDVAAAGLTEDLSYFFPAQSNDPACREPACNIQRVCGVMRADSGNNGGVNATSPPLERLAALAAAAVPAGDCLAEGSAAVRAQLTDTSLAGGGARVWLWQTCVEFGFFQTCDPDSRCPFTSSPWLNSLDSQLDACRIAFGDVAAQGAAAAVATTAAEFGALTPGSSRVMYVNAEIDPWYAASIAKPPGEQTPVLLVRGASHHAWTHPPQPTDSPEARALQCLSFRGSDACILSADCGGSRRHWRAGGGVAARRAVSIRRQRLRVV